MMKSKNIFTIDPLLPFGKKLVAHLLEQETSNDLSNYILLLPTRRACRLVQSLLLEMNEKPLLLPSFIPFGDLEEEDILLADPSFSIHRLSPVWKESSSWLS